MPSTSAEQSLREGRLDEALVQLQEQVRRQPAEAKYRVFLFQLLSVMGRWDRALTQLSVCGDLDDANLGMVQVYREAIRCELLRGRVFAGQTSPVVFGDPEPWIALLIEALKLDAQSEFENSATLRSQAFELAPASSGSLDGERFDWIADADGRLGPILEAIVNGRYYWIPFFRIAAISFEPPADLRDLVWLPARFVWANGGEAVGLIPSRYPGSERSDDGTIRMARKTCWEEPAPGCYQGLGQRLLTTGGGDYPLFEIREIRLDAGVPVNHG